MREIKFRAWDKEIKCMIKNPLNFPEWYPTNELMQYTGLKDKNGKEIYDGDILNMFPGFGCEWKPRIVTVTYRPASFWVDFDFGCQSFILDDHDCSFEVIGNIHQNPELLEV